MSTKAERIRELRDPDSHYYKSAENFLKKILADYERGGQEIGAPVLKRDEKVIPYTLRGEELAKLSAEFGWKLRVTAREFSRVPYVAAKTFCANALNESIKSWAGEEVVCLEGDVTAAVAKRQTWKHFCRAGVDTKALSRYRMQEETLRRMIGGCSADVALVASQVLGGDTTEAKRLLCEDAKNCCRSCDTVLFDLAMADISAKQAAVTAIQHSAARCKTWFYFDALMLHQDEGPLTAFPGRFFVDRLNDRLYIIPDGPTAADNIEYRWSNVLSYLGNSVVDVEGGSFLIEIHDSVPGTCFVSVSDARGECEYNVDSDVRLYHAAGEKSVEVVQNLVLPRSAGGDGTFREVAIRLPVDMWEKTVARMMAIKETKLTLAEARIAVADYTQQRVNIGAIIKAPRALSFDVPEIFARAAWKVAVVERLKMSLESHLAREGVDTKWGTVMQRLVACGVRYMHEKQATIGSFLLDAVQFIGVYDDDYQNYVVTVNPVATEETNSAVVQGFAGHYMCAGYPGGPAYDASSLTQASEVRARVRSEAMEVFEAVQFFGSQDSSVVGGDSDASTRGDGGIMFSQEKEVTHLDRKLTEHRESLVEKMQVVYGVDSIRPVNRVSEVLPSVREPVCQVETCTEDPVAVLQADYVESMPGLAGYNAEITPYLFGEADKSFDIEVPRLVTNGHKDGMPRQMKVRRSKLKTACSGRRPVTQSEAMLAFTKRVANAPVLSVDVVYAERLASDFEKFQEAVLRPGWQVRMKEAVAAGLWSLDMQEVRRHVAKLETTAVGSMMQEQFRTGNVDMTSWVAMVKSIAKPKVSEAAASVYSAPQTIVYQQSKMTNSYFSPILSKFLDFLDQESQPWIRLNARMDRSDDERWANSVECRSVGEGFHDVEVDISQCDKSQCLYNMMLFFYVLEQFGAPEELTSVWRAMVGLKRANAVDVGMAVWYMYQVVSGFFGTIAANTIITAVANIVCMDLNAADIVRAEFRGDDGLLRVRKDVNVALVSERFAVRFNMEAKVFVDAPAYFCSMYEVKVGDYLYRVRDPEKMREALGRFVSSTVDVGEMYRSFADAAVHYEKKEVLDSLADAVKKRTGIEVRGSLRALSSLAQRFDLFESSYEDELTVVGF